MRSLPLRISLVILVGLTVQILSVPPPEALASEEQPLATFFQLVDKEDGLTTEEKEQWKALIREKVEGKSINFDYSRLCYGILSQAKFDEVEAPKASQVIDISLEAVSKGAPEEIVSEMSVFAFSVNLNADELALFATITQKSMDKGVPLHITQEMIRHAKDEEWATGVLQTMMDGLMQAAPQDVDLEKIALFMLISIAQKLGAPEQIVADALADSKKREPVKWGAPEPSTRIPSAEPIPSHPRVALDYDTFLTSVNTFLGTPYVWGGTTRQGVDCSGFTRLVLQENGYTIPRVSRDQAKTGAPVDTKDLKLGDLVFFDTKGAGQITHVGLYLGGNLLVHASSSKGVIIILFDSPYFQSRYISARRVVKYREGG